MEAVLVRVVAAERCGFLDELAIAELAGDRARLLALPVAGGLDAKQVVAAAAVAIAHDRFAPTGFQCSLGHQVARVDADALGCLLSHRQHGGDEFVAVGKGFFRCQWRLGHGATDNAQPRVRHGESLGHLLAFTRRHGSSVGSSRRGHDTGQQAVGELAGQGQAPRIERSHVVAGAGRRGGMCRLCHLVAPQGRACVIHPREWAGVDRSAAALGQLAHQHVLQADAAPLAGHAYGQLLVVHVSVLLDRFGVHRVVVSQHIAGLARGLEHFADE